jgi:sugar/nucleoside kinase (ribokinase family)
MAKMMAAQARRLDAVAIGALVWDVIGQTDGGLEDGADVPGTIRRRPGGVAMNLAAALAAHGLRCAILAQVGADADGTALMGAAAGLGVDTSWIDLTPDLPTGQYVALEAQGRLIGAIADTAGLEAAGPRILAPLADGRLGDADSPFDGIIAIDGNLPVDVLTAVAGSTLFAAADLRICAASPAKAARLGVLLGHPRATFYLNLAEASVLAGRRFADARGAAQALVSDGARRVLVTDGPRPAAEAMAGAAVLRGVPKPVRVRRVTGAGDALMAAHIAAELGGQPRPDAFDAALAEALAHIIGDPP